MDHGRSEQNCFTQGDDFSSLSPTEKFLFAEKFLHKGVFSDEGGIFGKAFSANAGSDQGLVWGVVHSCAPGNPQVLGLMVDNVTPHFNGGGKPFAAQGMGNIAHVLGSIVGEAFVILTAYML